MPVTLPAAVVRVGVTSVAVLLPVPRILQQSAVCAAHRAHNRDDGGLGRFPPRACRHAPRMVTGPAATRVKHCRTDILHSCFQEGDRDALPVQFIGTRPRDPPRMGEPEKTIPHHARMTRKRPPMPSAWVSTNPTSDGLPAAGRSQAAGSPMPGSASSRVTDALEPLPDPVSGGSLP